MRNGGIMELSITEVLEDKELNKKELQLILIQV